MYIRFLFGMISFLISFLFKYFYYCKAISYNHLIQFRNMHTTCQKGLYKNMEKFIMTHTHRRTKIFNPNAAQPTHLLTKARLFSLTYLFISCPFTAIMFRPHEQYPEIAILASAYMHRICLSGLQSKY